MSEVAQQTTVERPAQPARRIGSALSAAVPAGWRQRQELTLVDGERRASVLFAVSDVTEPGLTTETYAQAQDTALATDFRNFRRIAFEPALVFGGHAGMRHHFVWEPEGRAPVEQIQLYLVHGDCIYLATATTRVEDWDELAPVLEDALLGLQIEGVAADPAPARTAVAEA